MDLNDWIQSYALITSITAAPLIASPRRSRRKLGFFIGAICQPAWIYLGWETGLWSLIALDGVYLTVYIIGIVNHWRDE